MRRLAEWLTASRSRAVLGAMLLAPLALLPLFVAWLPGAFIVLLALRRLTPAADWPAALVSALTLAWFLAGIGLGPIPALAGGATLVVPPLLVGRLLSRGGSLSLAFQLTVLALVGALVAVHLLLADPPGVWQPFVERLAAELHSVATAMSAVGSGWRPDDRELLEAASAIVNWGMATWLVLLNTMVAAFVGLYWAGLLEGAPRLGPEFRGLKAGRTLTLIAALCTALALQFRWNLPTDGSRLFLGVFVLQGLALLHSARLALGFSGAWLAATYGLLFVPFMASLVEGALAVFGFVDNWLPLRPRLAALATAGRGR